MGSGNKSLEQIAINTGQTAASVSMGGDLYEKMDELVKALKSGGEGKGSVSAKEALVLRITAGALKPIGLGLGVIIDALDRAPDGKELKLKMEALTNGLLSLADVGYSILKFAATMILATPLLLLAGIGAIIWVPLLKLMIQGLLWATEKLDKKALKKILVLGDVGKALLIMSGSLVLMSLLAPYILKGLLVAGAILLGFGLLGMLLDKMKIGKSLNKMAKTLKTLSLALLGLSVGLILIGLLTQPILVGLATASLIILTLAGVFWLIDKMQVDKAMRKTSRALITAAMAILSVSVSLVLSSLIISALGWEEVGKVLLLVGAVALAFYVIDKVLGKSTTKGATILMYAAGAILAVAVAIFLAKLLIGPVDAENALQTFGVLVIIGAVAVVFALAGVGEKFIKKGSIAMMFAGGAMIVIALGVYAMKKALEGVSWGNLGMMAAVIVGLAVAMGVAGIGPIPAAIALGSAAMIVAGIALITIGLGVTSFMAGLKDATWETVGMMGAIIVGVGLSFAAAGLGAPFIIIGAAAMAIAGLALLPVALGVLALSKLPIAEMFASKGLFGDSGQKTKGFLGIGGGRPMTNMEVMFEAIANSFSLGPLQLLALYATSPALILAGLSLITIGKGLQEFQKIAKDTDLTLLGLNVTLITTLLADAFGKIGKKFPGGAAGLFTSGSFVSQGITSVMGMGDALTSIAIGMQQMANLKFPVKYDKNGKAIAYESMDSDAPARVAANTMMIVDGLSRVFGEIGAKYPKGKVGFMDALMGNGGQSAVEVGISSVMGMGGALTSVATGFQAMANLKFPIAWDDEGKPTAYAEVEDLGDAAKRVSDNTKLIVTSLSSTFAEVGAGKTSSWWEGATNYEKGVEVVSGLGTPLKNLAEGVANMADMKFATGYDAEGKATGWINLADMKPEDLKDKIGTNTRILIEALTDVFITIGGGKAKTSSWWQGSTVFEKGIKVVNMVAEPYKKLVGAVKELSAFKDIDSDKIKTDLENLIAGFTTIGTTSDPTTMWNAAKLATAVGEAYAKMGKAIPSIASAKMDAANGSIFSKLLFGQVDAGKAALGYHNQMKMQHALAATYGKAGENFPKIQGAINSLDLTKLTESRKMFEALGVLSKGGSPGDILAQMGESLEDALDNLAEMLENFRSTVQEGNEQNTGVIEKMGNAVSNMVGSNSGSSSSPAPKIEFPSKMVVSLDRKSIDAIKEDGLGGGR